jgi:hypothetical protein
MGPQQRAFKETSVEVRQLPMIRAVQRHSCNSERMARLNHQTIVTANDSRHTRLVTFVSLAQLVAFVSLAAAMVQASD